MTEANDSYRAATLLAGMFYADTGIELTASTIETFINRRWERIAPLAHRVHGGAERDMTKAEVNAAAPVELTPMQKVRNLVARYGSETAERVRQEYGNRYPSADPVAVEVELLKAIEDLVKA